MGNTVALPAELIVVIGIEDRVVRVFENTPASRKALKEWQKLDEAFDNDKIPESDYRYLSEWMDEKGIKSYTTESRWDILS